MLQPDAHIFQVSLRSEENFFQTSHIDLENARIGVFFIGSMGIGTAIVSIVMRSGSWG
jgi:hypothetical protein